MVTGSDNSEKSGAMTRFERNRRSGSTTLTNPEQGDGGRSYATSHVIDGGDRTTVHHERVSGVDSDKPERAELSVSDVESDVDKSRHVKTVIVNGHTVRIMVKLEGQFITCSIPSQCVKIMDLVVQLHARFGQNYVRIHRIGDEEDVSIDTRADLTRTEDELLDKVTLVLLGLVQ